MAFTSATQNGINSEIENGVALTDWVEHLPESNFDLFDRLLASPGDSSQSGQSTPGYAPNMGSFDPAPSGSPKTAADVARCGHSAFYKPSGYTFPELQDAPANSVDDQADAMNSLSNRLPKADQNSSNGVRPMADVFHGQSVPANGMNSHGMVSAQTSNGFYAQTPQAYSVNSDAGAFGHMNGNFVHQQDPNYAHMTSNAVPDVQPSAFGAAPCRTSSSSYTQQTRAYSTTSGRVAPVQIDSGVVHQQTPKFVHTTVKLVAKPTESQFAPDQQPSFSSSGSSTEPNSADSTPQCSRASTPGKSKSTGICPVCGERATGKHYGIDCCDGCKSFFRRAIRGKRGFKCDRADNCDVKKSTPSRCRACRLKKCLEAGMKRSSVQSERDKLYRRGKASKTGDTGTRSTTETSSPTQTAISSSAARTVASLEDVSYFLTSMGPILHEWGTMIKGFSSFTIRDQSLLFHNHLGAHLLIEIAANSVNSYPNLMMGEEFIINRDLKAPTGHLGSIIRRNIMVPLLEVKPDKTELCLMELFILYDNTLPGIVNQELLMDNQAFVFLELEKHIHLKYPSKTTARLDQICALIDGFTTTACELSRILARRPSSQECR